MVVCHFGLLNKHFASISGYCFGYLKLDVIPCSTAIPVYHVFSFFLSYYLYRGQKYGLICLNDRIICDYRIINQFS